ncbi:MULTISPECIES: type IV pilus modification protein PilV [Pseudomonas]|uniref:Type IV pilus modification protein PilV n=1 Tax=Pseudomonas gingeri TaxID=117681 RepID=A0A7Y7WNJ3_9PSED|nr:MULTISPECIES: type IV pilus modification protein PilV [Pseudomonas]NWB84486.1 type IV pilus modification protein PilV [Pseudomonas gingeri]
MRRTRSARQSGMTLVEVLISVLILAIGLLGAAAIQLDALIYTDSSKMRSQASFIAYDMMDRIRANPDADYTLASAKASTATAASTAARDADFYDFKTNINNFAGVNGDGNIVVNGRAVTIVINWSDQRAANMAHDTASPSFTLNSRVAVDPVAGP